MTFYHSTYYINKTVWTSIWL